MSALADTIRQRLHGAADPSRAPGQQAYMKSAMPYLGVAVPAVRAMTRAAAKGADLATLLTAADELWDAATHREERYAAIGLIGMPAALGDRSTVPLIEHFARTGQWWDFIDELAHRVSALHDAHPAETAALVRSWSNDPDFWMRRLAILSQLQRGQRTDPALLANVITPNLANPEFFIRKGIGWALRDYAHTDPEWVRRFASEHELSPLSRREALKHVGPA
ncbi:MAG: DNA alkylation repair protein [Protaetiibacter sp.]